MTDLPNANITVDYSEATQFAQPFSAQNVVKTELRLVG